MSTDNDKTSFSGKKLLMLVCLDNIPYWNFLEENFRRYFGEVIRFNFIEYSRQNGISATERRIRELIEENGIDMVFAFSLASDFELSPSFYLSLKDRVPLVCWFFDDDSFCEVISRYYGQAATAVVTTDYLPLASYSKLGIPAVYYSPVQDTKIFFPVGVKKDIDVCFLGDCTKSNRSEFIEFLAAAGVKIETYGFGSKNGFVAQEGVSALFSRSKIVLCFAKVDGLTWLTQDDPLLGRVRQNKGHFSQVALTGSFCLSEYAPSLGRIAEIGKEVEVFGDKKELLEKVRYYLSHEKEREAIAANARKRAVASFSAETAFPRFMNELSAVLADRRFENPYSREIFLSDGFKAKAVNGLTFSLFILLASGRLGNALELSLRLFGYGSRAFLAGFPAGCLRASTVLYHKISGKYREANWR